MLWCTCGGQRITLWHPYTPSTFTWIPGIELISLGLHNNHLHLLSHPAGFSFYVCGVYVYVCCLFMIAMAMSYYKNYSFS